MNFGGYDPTSIAELHQFGLFVARSAADAKRKGKAALLTGSLEQHKDEADGRRTFISLSEERFGLLAALLTGWIDDARAVLSA